MINIDFYLHILAFYQNILTLGICQKTQPYNFSLNVSHKKSEKLHMELKVTFYFAITLYKTKSNIYHLYRVLLESNTSYPSYMLIFS